MISRVRTLPERITLHALSRAARADRTPRSFWHSSGHSRSSAALSFSVARTRVSWVLPTAAMGVRISWAMPATSMPRAAILFEW